MALNVYRSEQRIHFGHVVADYFGWYITTSSSSESVEQLRLPDMRDRLVQVVAERFPGRDRFEHERIAALLVSRHFNGDESIAADLLANSDEFNVVDHLFDDWFEVIERIAGHSISLVETEP